MTKILAISVSSVALLLLPPFAARAQTAPPVPRPKVLHAAHMLDIETGRLISPGEVLVMGDRIQAVGPSVPHPPNAEVIDLGSSTLMPGLIDAHVHLFLHPGAEDAQTLRESVAQRTIYATIAAREDLMAGFTAERDMGTEGAEAADTAVRDAINQGLIPGPRMRISGNAISIVGGHEDADGYNPALHLPSNATYADSADGLVRVIRQQLKDGADFIKIYETGADSISDGKFSTPYQYTAEELRRAVTEAARQGRRVAVHATGEPGTHYAAEAGVASIDHALQLSDATEQVMKAKQIFAVPTLTIFEVFAATAAPAQAEHERAIFNYHLQEFRKQVAAGVPMAVGSDVGPFPHGKQAREFELMVDNGMTPLAVLQADYINGAKLLGWENEIGKLKPGYYADIIAVPDDPLKDIHTLSLVSFVMKGGVVYRR